MENKTSKYLKYAIGEIVLVVIGILIALQVNKWNQNRLEQAELHEILYNLKSDFTNAIIEFKNLNSLRETILNTTYMFYKITGEDIDNYSKQSLDSMVSRTLYQPSYNNQSGTLQLLFSSGKLNLISNKTLRDLLIKWPGEIDDMVEGEGYGNEVFRSDYWPILYKYLSVQDVISWLKWEEVNLEIKEKQLLIVSDYIGLFKDKSFINALSRRELELAINISETNELIDYAKQVISEIDKEMGND